ncbi:MAG: calcium-binding protein, partial [Brevundimonas sp.]
AADQATYTLGDADVGGVIRVIVSYTDGQGFANTVTSAGTGAIANINDAATGSVSITGSATEDEVLTADASALADNDGLGTLHYQWQRDTGSGFVNVGADQATYTLGDADVGGVVRVVVYYTDQQGTVESVTSAVTGAIANIDDAAVAQNDAVSTVESAAVSGNLFADNGSGADADVDGPALTIASVNGSPASVGTQITLASGALLTVNADGTYSYNPNGRFDNLPGAGSGSISTATDTFTYTLVGGDTATVTVTINGEFSPTGDVQVGTAGDDTQSGGNGNDTFVGGAGDDTINGGPGADTVTYSTAPTGVIVRLNHGDVPNDGFGGTDTITGVENVTGTAFNDTLVGAGGSNVLIGGAGYDILLGLGGDDVLIGGSGAANELYGGGGNDTYYVDANDTIVEQAGEGIDTVVTTRSVMFLANNLERLYFSGTGDATLTGNDSNNTIVGGAGNDLITGGGGYDVLIGGNGNDTLRGGSGAANELYGGQGDDTYIVDAYDTIVDNIVNGRSGNDILTGGGGNDTLNGGDGRDTAVLRGVASDYTITFVTGSTWTITDNVAGRDGVDTISNIERLSFSDGTFRILTPLPANPLPAPTLSDEDMGGRLVRPALTDGDFALTVGDGDELTLPSLTHDDFLFAKGGDLGPQVQPGLLDGGEPLVLPAEDPFGRVNPGLVPAPLTDDTMLVHPQHDDWML